MKLGNSHMIVYNKTKKEFSDDILTNDIGNIILKHIKFKTGKSVSLMKFVHFRIRYPIWIKY